MSRRKIEFRQFETHCTAVLDNYMIVVETPRGSATDQQLALAQDIVENLHSHLERATRYLDLFVDREKACGNADEQWFLDEITLLDHDHGAALVYKAGSSLTGDDGGCWTVRIRAFDYSENPHERGIIPFSFSRDQG